jgi:hypothetical protein
VDFYQVVDQVVELLRHRGRVSYRALQRQFGLDDACLEDLKTELIVAQRLVRWLSTDRSWYGREGQRRPYRSGLSQPPHQIPLSD